MHRGLWRLSIRAPPLHPLRRACTYPSSPCMHLKALSVLNSRLPDPTLLGFHTIVWIYCCLHITPFRLAGRSRVSQQPALQGRQYGAGCCRDEGAGGRLSQSQSWRDCWHLQQSISPDPGLQRNKSSHTAALVICHCSGTRLPVC